MPELPEVETVRVGLERHVVGRQIAGAQVLHPRAVRRDPAGPGGFEAAIAGLRFAGADRRGKYLWLPTSDDQALLAHLGMSGQMLLTDPDQPMSPHVRVRFTFTDGGPDLRFTDQRTFGHLMLVDLAPAGRGGTALAVPAVGPAFVDPGSTLALTPRRVPAPIAHIAPDPLEAAFSPAEFAFRLRNRRTGIKRALLDQSLISGIGNIYADEALWRARLHWARPTETLRPSEVTRLLGEVTEVLTSALRAGGTSFDSLYVNVNGESGYFERSLEAYGREGQPCGRCAAPIRRDSFMNRSSFSCPRCQPRPRKAHW